MTVDTNLAQWHKITAHSLFMLTKSRPLIYSAAFQSHGLKALHGQKGWSMILPRDSDSDSSAEFSDRLVPGSNPVVRRNAIRYQE